MKKKMTRQQEKKKMKIRVVLSRLEETALLLSLLLSAAYSMSGVFA